MHQILCYASVHTLRWAETELHIQFIGDIIGNWRPLPRSSSPRYLRFQKRLRRLAPYVLQRWLKQCQIYLEKPRNISSILPFLSSSLSPRHAVPFGWLHYMKSSAVLFVRRTDDNYDLCSCTYYKVCMHILSGRVFSPGFIIVQQRWFILWFSTDHIYELFLKN